MISMKIVCEHHQGSDYAGFRSLVSSLGCVEVLCADYWGLELGQAGMWTRWCL